MSEPQATQNHTGYDPATPLSGRRERAALLVAEDELTNEAIAKQIGVTRSTIDQWRRRDEFAARVIQLRTDIAAAVQRQGIANKQNRIDVLVNRHRLMEQVIEERAAAGGEASGATTGLLVRTIKIVGVGRDQQVVEEWAVDTGLLNEMRNTEKQVAQETGDWEEKIASSSVIYEYIGLDPDRFDAEDGEAG